MVGVTERGRLGPFEANSFDEWVNEYGGFTTDSLDMAVAAMGYYDNGGKSLTTIRTVHYTDLTDPTTKASVAASVNIDTTSTQTYGSVTMGVAAPVRLDPADTLIFSVDGGANETATFDASAGFIIGAGAAVGGFVGGETLTLAIDFGVTQTITMQAGDITVPLVAQRINNELEGGWCEVIAGPELKVWSDLMGTDSDVEIIGGTGRAAMGLAIGNNTGLGDVGNIRAVTALEIQTVVVADCASLSVVEVTISANVVTFATPTIGIAGDITCMAASTADDATKCDLDNVLHAGTAAGAGAMATLTAKSDGAWANGWDLVVSAASNGDATYFDAKIQDSDGVAKRYYVNCITTTTDPDYFVDKINDDAENFYATIADLLSGTAPANRPTNGTYSLAAGNSGIAALADTDFVGNSAGPTGLYELDTVEDLRTLIVPGKGTSTVHNGMITYCDTWRNLTVQAIFDPPANYTDAQIRTYVVTTAALKGASETAMITWPRGHIANPRPAVISNDDTNKNVGLVNVPTSGHVAGVWARSDAAHAAGVYQPPAGTDLPLRGLLGVEINSAGQKKHPVDDSRKRAQCYDDLINCIRKGPGGVFIDGTRMLKADGNFPTVGQRRGASHVKITIETGMPWIPHKNITKALRSRIDRTVRGWLKGETTNGAFVSDKPAEAFSWNIGDDLNPASVQAQRRIKASLGLAFAEPADFMDVDLYKDTRAYEEELARS